MDSHVIYSNFDNSANYISSIAPARVAKFKLRDCMSNLDIRMYVQGDTGIWKKQNCQKIQN